MSLHQEAITAGYLDVKISTKVKRGFTPWKAWRSQWCEINRLDSAENGLEIKMSSSVESNSSNSICIPRNAMICRTESRSQQFAFGIFGSDRDHKPLLFLSGATESDSQIWMYSIRKFLSLTPYSLIPNDSFYVSLVDNVYSRSANITGVHGILTTDTHGITLRNPCTMESVTTMQWYQFHQFHLAATGSLEDEKRIIVMHTSKDFHGGAGQLHFYCLNAPQLLEVLVSRGKSNQKFMSSRRFSRSEGDLRDTNLIIIEPPMSPVHFRSHSGSDDSGVRVSMASDDSSLVLKCKMSMNYLSAGFTGMIGATPGGSEIDNDSVDDLLDNMEQMSFIEEMQFLNNKSHPDPRRESGVSVLSGVYEEISEIPPPPKEFRNVDQTNPFHFYEDPVDMMLGSSNQNLTFLPPPLPPRQDTLTKFSSFDSDFDLLNCAQSPVVPTPSEQMKRTDSKDFFCDLLNDSLYTVMNSNKPQAESHYVPMFPIKDHEENPYLVMNGKSGE